MQTAYKQMDIDAIMKPVKLKVYRVWHKEGYNREVTPVTASTAKEAQKKVEQQYPTHRVTKVWLVNK